MYSRLCTANQRLSDTIANLAKMEPAIADTPCDDILGLVVYDLPGRDCAAKASNGELKYSELSRYKTEYIDGMCLFLSPSSLPQLFLTLLVGIATNMYQLLPRS